MGSSVGGRISFPFPLVSLDGDNGLNPLDSAAARGGFGGDVGKGRVRSRSAREY